MTCPTDGIETAGTWHCAQRWTAIRGMIGFRNAVAGTFTATVVKGSAVALYAGATPANWAGTRKYDPSDPAWFTGETPHKGDDTAAKSADSAASAKSGDAKSGKERPMPSAAPQRSPPSSCPSSSASRSWR